MSQTSSKQKRLPTVVITMGTFDLFHMGHLRILERAAAMGDVLVVGVSTDKLNWSKKQRLPICPYTERARIVQSLKCVHRVFPEHRLEDKTKYLKEHGANVFVMGDDHVGRFDQAAADAGCAMVYLPRTSAISTTERLARIRHIHNGTDDVTDS